MTTDRFANAFTQGTPETAQAIDDFTHGFLAYQPKAANILAAAEAAPDHALTNTYAGMLWMFLEAPVAATKAAPYIARAKAAVEMNEREHSNLKIASTWVSGDVPKTICIRVIWSSSNSHSIFISTRATPPQCCAQV
jgi:hypothetical protein